MQNSVLLFVKSSMALLRGVRSLQPALAGSPQQSLLQIILPSALPSSLSLQHNAELSLHTAHDELHVMNLNQHSGQSCHAQHGSRALLSLPSQLQCSRGFAVEAGGSPGGDDSRDTANPPPGDKQPMHMSLQEALTKLVSFERVNAI